MLNDISKKTVLLIEPDNDLRASMLEELKDLTQMTIIEARDGIEASSKIRKQTFNIIILETEVSKISGIELIKLARDTKENEITPIIVYTTELESIKLFTRAVKNIEYIQKPTDLNILSEKIINWSQKDLKRKEFRLDVDFINPFIDSAIETLESMCKAENLKPGKTYLLGKDEKLDIDISGILKLSCPYFKGTIAISFADKVYQQLVTKILNGKQDNVNIDNQDAAAEMINIVFGKTKAQLNAKGYRLKRAIPTVMRGEGHNVQSQKVPVLLLPFDSDSGKFFIQICVEAT